MSLAGRRVVITGAAQGIGAAIARRAADAGAHVALLDADATRVNQSAEEIGNGALAITCDVADEASVDAAAERVQASLGGADVLVNNAAIFRPGGLETLSVEDWRSAIRVNLTGAFLCSRRFVTGMLERGDGAIVNIGSIASGAPAPGAGAYPAAKGGLVAYSVQAALEWSPRGVRVNIVLPGRIATERRSAGPLPSADLIPLGRLGTPEEVAAVVVFLAGPAAASISGTVVAVDGGLTPAILAAAARTDPPGRS